MPSRNIVRVDSSDSYYHVYARGGSKSDIFLLDDDKDYFMYLLSRYLSRKPTLSLSSGVYPNFRNRVELVSYCLMDNHFHLLVYQLDAGALSEFMKCLMSSYSLYFNKKYGRSGPLFESRFKSSLITSDPYLLHISRYIHLNPRYWKRFPYSSFRYFCNGGEPEWLQIDRVLQLFNDRKAYAEFVADYEANKLILKKIKHQLAN